MTEMEKSNLREKCLYYRQSLKDDIELLKSLGEFIFCLRDLYPIQTKLEEAYMFMGQHLLFNPTTREEKYNYESFLSWFSFPPLPLDYEKYYESFKDVEKDLDCRFVGFNSAAEQNAIRAKKEDRNYESRLDASCLNTGSYTLTATDPSVVRPATCVFPLTPLRFEPRPYEYEDYLSLQKVAERINDTNVEGE